MASELDDTEGMTQFVSFSDQVGWRIEPIPRAKTRTPDLKVSVAEYEFVVEVKTLMPNKEERAANERSAKGQIGTRGCTPGKRVKGVINDANEQIKAVAGESPAMLVIFNATGTSLHTKPYSVMTAMQGLDVVDVLVSSDPAIRPLISNETRSGPGRAMAPAWNSSTSAVAVIQEDAEGSPILLVFHNQHAAKKLEPDAIRSPRVHQFSLPPDAKNSVESEWMKV
jgi:hypothetical protein